MRRTSVDRRRWAGRPFRARFHKTFPPSPPGAKPAYFDLWLWRLSMDCVLSNNSPSRGESGCSARRSRSLVRRFFSPLLDAAA